MPGLLTASDRKQKYEGLENVASSVEKLLGLLAKEIVHQVEDLRDYLHNPRFNVDLDKIRIDQAIEKLLDLGLNEFLNPQNEQGEKDERHSIQFGVYGIKVRAKTSKSIAEKLFKIAFPSHKEPNVVAEELWNDLRAHIDSLDIAAKRSLLGRLNEQIQDLFGARVIVLSQRCKFNIARALNLVANHADDQFLRRINDEMKKRSPAGEANPPMIRLAQLQGQPWLIYNPPAGYLYSSPASVQGFFDALNGYDYEVMRADSRTLGAAGAGELGDRQRHRVEAMGAALDNLQGIEFKLSFRPSGYATFQRTFECRGLGFSFRFELQVRTLLEDAWAEPEHRLSYKPNRPMSERTKMMFRNYGAQLAGADDLLQIITDLWEEETREQPSLFENVFHNYPRHQDPEDAPRMKPDLDRFYMLRNNGYLSTALAFMRRMIPIYDGWSAEVDAMLLIEEAVTMAQMAEDEAKAEVAVERLKRVHEIASSAQLDSEQFSSRFRLASCRLQKVRLRIDKNRHDRPDATVVDVASVRELDEISADFTECYKSIKSKKLLIKNKTLNKHISDEYHIGGILCDIVSQKALCYLLKSIAGDPSQRLGSLEAARAGGEECFVQAQFEVFSEVPQRGSIPPNSEEFSAECRDKKKGDPDIYRIDRLRWFAIWGCNIILYSVLLCQESATPSQVQWAESSFDWLTAFKTEYGEIEEFVTSPGEGSKEEIKKVQDIIDKVAMQELKVIHSLIWYGYCTAKPGFEQVRLATCMGAIRHRLVQICCLGEHGFERGFFENVNKHLRTIKNGDVVRLGSVA